VDATTPENISVLEVRKARGPNPPFNPQTENETFIEAM